MCLPILERSGLNACVDYKTADCRLNHTRMLRSTPYQNVIDWIFSIILQEFFVTGSMIVRQGDRGDKFYIIRGGKVVISKRPPDGGPEEFVQEISEGDYFGEQALLHEDRRLATVTAKAPGVECLTLDRMWVDLQMFYGYLSPK